MAKRGWWCRCPAPPAEHNFVVFNTIALVREDRFMFQQMTSSLASFLKDESGPTAVEYAVMPALMTVVCISAITTLGGNANNTFSYVGQNVGKTSS
jgi:pilus assembly protein Flp/PilA